MDVNLADASIICCFVQADASRALRELPRLHLSSRVLKEQSHDFSTQACAVAYRATLSTWRICAEPLDSEYAALVAQQRVPGSTLESWDSEGAGWEMRATARTYSGPSLAERFR